MSKNKTLLLAEGAVMIALATVLSFVKVFTLPWGGSVTLLSMLPICIYSIRRGPAAGFVTAFVYALIQLYQGIAIDGLLGWGLTGGMLCACIFFDYVGAFAILGGAGMFRKKGFAGYISGIALVVLIRYGFHILSGAFIFHSVGLLWDGFSTQNPYVYSLLYNGCYMLPELIFTVVGAAILLKAPATRRFLVSGNEN